MEQRQRGRCLEHASYVSQCHSSCARETFSSQGAGEAARRCCPGQLAPRRRGLSVVASSPRLLGLCVLCAWDAELLPQKSSALNFWNKGLLRWVKPQDVRSILNQRGQGAVWLWSQVISCCGTEISCASTVFAVNQIKCSKTQSYLTDIKCEICS